jgi:hypothetical protein
VTNKQTNKNVVCEDICLPAIFKNGVSEYTMCTKQIKQKTSGAYRRVRGEGQWATASDQTHVTSFSATCTRAHQHEACVQCLGKICLDVTIAQRCASD